MRKYMVAVCGGIVMVLLTAAVLQEKWVKEALTPAEDQRVQTLLKKLEYAQPGEFVNIGSNAYVVHKVEPRKIILHGRGLENSTRVVQLNYIAIAQMPFDQLSIVPKNKLSWNETAEWFYVQ